MLKMENARSDNIMEIYMTLKEKNYHGITGIGNR